MPSLYIGSLTEQGFNLDAAVDADRLGMLDAVSSESGVQFIQPVRVSIHATRAGATVQINGMLTSRVNLPCSRCLERFDLDIETVFSATAVPGIASVIEPEDVQEIELAADDMDVMVYDGERIDLRDEIAQQLIMALPFKPLCRERCKGLCSRCGADRNKTPCQCISRDDTNPFAALKTLALTKKQE